MSLTAQTKTTDYKRLTSTKRKLDCANHRNSRWVRRGTDNVTKAPATHG